MKERYMNLLRKILKIFFSTIIPLIGFIFISYFGISSFLGKLDINFSMNLFEYSLYIVSLKMILIFLFSTNINQNQESNSNKKSS